MRGIYLWAEITTKQTNNNYKHKTKLYAMENTKPVIASTHITAGYTHARSHTFFIHTSHVCRMCIHYSFTYAWHESYIRTPRTLLWPYLIILI